MHASRKVFLEWKGGETHLYSSKKTSLQIVKILILGDGGVEHANTYYLLQLRFHCDFPDFYLESVFTCSKRGRGTQRFYNFLSVN